MARVFQYGDIATIDPVLEVTVLAKLLSRQRAPRQQQQHSAADHERVCLHVSSSTHGLMPNV
jgi:hypothetical protein